MSAVKIGTNNVEASSNGRNNEKNFPRTIHKFHQSIKIPSYLLAIVVGDIVCQPIGPRSKVCTEKEMLERSVYEFGETEKMLSNAEELLGPYEWGKLILIFLNFVIILIN